MESGNQGDQSGWKERIYNIYDKHYKKLLIFPFLILLLSIGQIGYQIYSTGSFIQKDVSLKGGVTVTVPYDKEIDVDDVTSQIASKFPGHDVSTRILRNSGAVAGIIIEADIDGNDKEQIQKYLAAIESALKTTLEGKDYGLEIVGSSLGATFFHESAIALSVAFLFMGLVVLIYFRSYLPSVAIILATLCDMLMSLAIVNLLGMKIGTAGIAAFLMLIGYGVDTNILLTVRVLKRKEGDVMQGVMSSLKTGMTMTIITVISTTAVLIVTQSEIIRQIMIIMLAGLFADMIFTWIQNVGLLRLHLERKARKGMQK